MDVRLPPDWREFFAELLAHEVRFVVVGALAVAAHAEPRFTEDLDVFAEPSQPNAKRLRAALLAFGFGEAVPPARELAKAGPIWMLGRKPLRIDILTEISGVSWADAWRGRVMVDIDGVLLPVIGHSQLVANKAAAGRPKDLHDLAVLRSPGRATKKRVSKTARRKAAKLPPRSRAKP